MPYFQTILLNVLILFYYIYLLLYLLYIIFFFLFKCQDESVQTDFCFSAMKYFFLHPQRYFLRYK